MSYSTAASRAFRAVRSSSFCAIRYLAYLGFLSPVQFLVRLLFLVNDLLRGGVGLLDFGEFVLLRLLHNLAGLLLGLNQ
jgi:hypothetical protein